MLRKLLLALPFALLLVPVGTTVAMAAPAVPCIMGALCPPGATAPTPQVRPSNQPTPKPSQAPTPQPSSAPTSQPSPGTQPSPAPSPGQPSPQPSPQASPQPGQGQTPPTDFGYQYLVNKAYDGATWSLHLLQQTLGYTDRPVDWFAPIYARFVNLAWALMLMMGFAGIAHAVLNWRRGGGALLLLVPVRMLLAVFFTATAVSLTAMLMKVTDIASDYVINTPSGQATQLISHLAVLFAAGGAGLAGAAAAGVGSFVAAWLALGLMVAAIGVILEMLIREAVIYMCLAFLPISFACSLWPKLMHWLLRLVEILIGVIILKFVVYGIIGIGATMFAAGPNATSQLGDPGWGAALMGLVVLGIALFGGPMAVARIIPMAEGVIMDHWGQHTRRASSIPQNIAGSRLQNAAAQRNFSKGTGSAAALAGGTTAGQAAMLITQGKDGQLTVTQGQLANGKQHLPEAQGRQPQEEPVPAHGDEDHPHAYRDNRNVLRPPERPEPEPEVAEEPTEDE